MVISGCSTRNLLSPSRQTLKPSDIKPGTLVVHRLDSIRGTGIIIACDRDNEVAKVLWSSDSHSFPAPTLWLKAGVGVTVDTTTGRVIRWEDQSGNGNDFVSGT